MWPGARGSLEWVEEGICEWEPVRGASLHYLPHSDGGPEAETACFTRDDFVTVLAQHLWVDVGN